LQAAEAALHERGSVLKAKGGANQQEGGQGNLVSPKAAVWPVKAQGELQVLEGGEVQDGQGMPIPPSPEAVPLPVALLGPGGAWGDGAKSPGAGGSANPGARQGRDHAVAAARCAGRSYVAYVLVGCVVIGCSRSWHGDIQALRRISAASKFTKPPEKIKRITLADQYADATGLAKGTQMNVSKGPTATFDDINTKIHLATDVNALGMAKMMCDMDAFQVAAKVRLHVVHQEATQHIVASKGSICVERTGVG